ncbi:hypothetical protein [Streptomyces sp. NPDC094032]|uniref:hypothetical protein n=1 Tax=Streptomyces sp. NPDC094032 TaxID=3155308 RepID=UPI0033180237
MTEAGSAPGQGPLEELEFVTHRQESIRVAVRLGEERRAPGRPRLTMRRLFMGDGWPVVQFRLPRSAQGDPRAYALLVREVEASVAVERRYEGEKFADLFTRIVGFDLECAEPFVLYHASPGSTLFECQERLGGEEKQKIVGQLALAVRVLGDAGLVHRALTPETVRWTGAHIRLSEPYAAQRAGEPREPFGTAPWASPEQRAGRGAADTRDDLWSLARIAYFLISEQPGAPGIGDRADGPPADLGAYRRLTALAESGLFAPVAAARPSPAELLRLLSLRDPLADFVDTADPLDRGRERYDAELARKQATLKEAREEEERRRNSARGEPYPPRSRWFPRGNREGDRPPAPPPPTEPPPPPTRMCPYCLLPVQYDESRLVTIDDKGNRTPLDLSGEHRPAHRKDALRTAYHLCPHAEGDEAHELPVAYFLNGEPLSIAFVGSSAVGKTHLMASMIGEVELGGLEPYGLKVQPLDPDTHRSYLRGVQNLQQGRQLGRTGQQDFPQFADGLLVTVPGRIPRPVIFFDLAGEDLAQDGAVTRFLLGVDAFVFVVDPLRALRMPGLDPVRERYGLPLRDLGDETFTTVLNRLDRPHGFIPAPAAVAVNKSDLMRFEPVVDRWLGRALPERYDEQLTGAESRDAYAFLDYHASPAWLRPFDDHAHCTLHFVTATGGQARGDRFPHGARPQRVLSPLLSVFAACGLLRGRG